MPDRADEIAAELWDKAWDCNRAEGLGLIVEWMRQYAAEKEAAERERCAKIADRWAKSITCTPGEVCDHIRTGTEIAAQIRGGE